MKKFLSRLAIALPLVGAYAFSCTYTGMYRLPFLIALLGFSLIALLDYYRLATRNGSHRPAIIVGIAFSVLISVFFWNESLKVLPSHSDLPSALRSISISVSIKSEFAFALILGFSFLTLIWVLFRKTTDGALYSTATTVFGVFYTTISICHTALFLTLPDAVFYGWLVSWCTFMGDTAAYIAGKLWGKHPLGIFVSPHKTLEGYLGGAVLSVLFAHLFYFVAHNFFTVPRLSVLTVTLSALGIYLLTIAGDLVESLLKRDGGQKDSGSYLGDHGGLLDVIDSYLLTLPFSYYWLKWYL